MDLLEQPSPLPSPSNISHLSSPLSGHNYLPDNLRKSLNHINKEERRLNAKFGTKISKKERYGKDRAPGSFMDPTLSDLHC